MSKRLFLIDCLVDDLNRVLNPDDQIDVCLGQLCLMADRQGFDQRTALFDKTLAGYMEFLERAVLHNARLADVPISDVIDLHGLLLNHAARLRQERQLALRLLM
jgi:hypothetical protein